MPLHAVSATFRGSEHPTKGSVSAEVLSRSSKRGAKEQELRMTTIDISCRDVCGRFPIMLMGMSAPS